jgi:hypothetical protein
MDAELEKLRREKDAEIKELQDELRRIKESSEKGGKESEMMVANLK